MVLNMWVIFQFTIDFITGRNVEIGPHQTGLPLIGGQVCASHSGRASAVQWEWLQKEPWAWAGASSPRGAAHGGTGTWTRWVGIEFGLRFVLEQPSYLCETEIVHLSFGKDQMGRCVDGVCHEIVLYMPLKLVVKVARALRLPSPAMMAHFSHFSMWAEALAVPGYPGLPVFLTVWKWGAQTKGRPGLPRRAYSGGRRMTEF